MNTPYFYHGASFSARAQATLHKNLTRARYIPEPSARDPRAIPEPSPRDPSAIPARSPSAELLLFSKYATYHIFCWTSLAE